MDALVLFICNWHVNMYQIIYIGRKIGFILFQVLMKVAKSMHEYDGFCFFTQGVFINSFIHSHISIPNFSKKNLVFIINSIKA